MTVTDIAIKMCHDKKYLPRDGMTFCNEYVMDVLKALGCPLDRYYSANDMIDLFESKYRKLDVIGALTATREGGIVIAGMKHEGHGHVSVLIDHNPELSGTWGKYAPFLANVGQKNGVMKASFAFRSEPVYYLVRA